MLSIIIVNYKSLARLKVCLRSISEKMAGLEHEVLIVNNDAEPIQETFPASNLKLIEVNRNIGFGSACNIGAREAKGEYLCFLNPDTKILSSNFKKLLEKFETDQYLGIISPDLLTENGVSQRWGFGGDPNFWQVIKNNLLPEKNFSRDLPFETDWVSGAALFIRKDLFEKLAGFDENFFMYFEDIDLCKRARKLSSKISVFPEFKIMHFGGESFENKKTQKDYYYESQNLYFLKHFGKFSLFLLRFFRLFH